MARRARHRRARRPRRLRCRRDVARGSREPLIVIDASALVEHLLKTLAGQQVRRELRGRTTHAPHLLDLEVTSVLRRAVTHGAVDHVRAERALRRMQRMRVRRYEHGPLLRRIWELRNNLTPYDAAYVALAERLGAPLLTLDRRLRGAAGILAEVIVIEPVD